VPKTSFNIVILLAALAFGLMVASGVMATRLSAGSWLDYAFTARQTQRFLYAYTIQDIALHRWVTTHLSLAMPIILAAFAIMMIHHDLDHKKYAFLVALAVWASVADYAENLVIVSLLDGGGAFRLKAALTLIKMALLLPPQTVAVYLFLKTAKTRLSAA
jgi:hypothetical protein